MRIRSAASSRAGLDVAAQGLYNPSWRWVGCSEMFVQLFGKD